MHIKATTMQCRRHRRNSGSEQSFDSGFLRPPWSVEQHDSQWTCRSMCATKAGTESIRGRCQFVAPIWTAVQGPKTYTRGMLSLRPRHEPDSQRLEHMLSCPQSTKARNAVAALMHDVNSFECRSALAGEAEEHDRCGRKHLEPCLQLS